MAGYAKLFSTITDSSLWSEAKEVRILFVSMLAKADADGFIEAAVPGLARAANLTVDEVRKSLDVLESPDPHSKNPAFDGRRVAKVPGGWVLLNYQDYRNRGGAKGGQDDRRGYMREYMRKYRAENRQDVNSVSTCKHPVNEPVRQGEAEGEARGRSISILSSGPIGADQSADSPQSKRKFLGRGEGEALDLSLVDWSSVEAMAEAVAVRVPPKSTEDRRAWLRYAVMAAVTFGEGWLMNAAETARATRQQNGTKASRQAHFVAILKAEAAKQGVDAETFNGIARRIEIPDDVWKSGVISVPGKGSK